MKFNLMLSTVMILCCSMAWAEVTEEDAEFARGEALAVASDAADAGQ